MPTVGMIFQPTNAPEDLVAAAQYAEDAGVREMWLWEDCFAEGGIASLSTALASTSRLRVGLGVLPMPLRNVAVAAMEVATIERLFPGRAAYGVGHGVQTWMAQTGTRVASPLTLMREFISSMRRLLAGEEVSFQGRYVQLDHVRLNWPPTIAPSVLAAGEGPKTLSLTGTVADGTVLSSGTSPAMVRRASDLIRDARVEAGRGPDHELIVYLMAAFGSQGVTQIEDEFDAWKLSGERRFAAVGSDTAVESAIQALIDAGATTVLLQATAQERNLSKFTEAVSRVANRFE